MPNDLRLYIVGTCGVGKSTLGRRLAADFSLDHIEIDELYWGPNWTPRPDQTVTEALQKRVAGDAWAVTGNYSAFRPTVLARATHVVWLNFSAVTVARQLLARTCHRTWHRNVLFGGCVETFRRSFLSRDSILLWAVKTFRSNRRRYKELFASPAVDQIECVELRSRAEVESWLATLQASSHAPTNEAADHSETR